MRIKDELVGPECEGIELFPARSREVDTANHYHLWIIDDPAFRFPFGLTGAWSPKRPLVMRDKSHGQPMNAQLIVFLKKK